MVADQEPDENRSPAVHRNQSRNQSNKACVNCARIKCRCISREDSTSCERCHRLGKTCTPSGPAKQRGPKRGAPSRSARLEEKLDDLVSLLRDQQALVTPTQGGNASVDIELDDDANSLSTGLVSTPPTGEDYSEVLSLLEAKESLSRFSEEMIIFTPYIYIPPDMTSAQIRQSYPFLWLNIIAVASKSVKTRKTLSLQNRRIIIERVVAGGERSLDLLLGILTFVNWVHLFPMDKQFASLASQLAVSLVWDLGLQMPPPEHPTRFPPSVSVTSRSPIRQQRTIEEKRAVLGAFVITSMLSQTLKSANGFRWSAYLDQYLTDISDHSIIPQDKVLARQVEMQLIVNQFRYSSWKISNMEVPTAWVDVLQLQLDQIIGPMNGTSPVLGSKTTLFGFYYYTTLIIREGIIARSSTPVNEPDMRRYEVYQRCVNSIKAWLDIYFSMPLAMYTSVPCSTYSQLCYVVLFLHHITTTRDASWNPTAGQEVMDPLQTVDRVIRIFDQVKAAAVTDVSGSGEDQALSLGIRKFQTLRSIWYSELRPQDKDETTVEETEMVYSSQTLFPTDPLESFGFHLLPDTGYDSSWQ